MPVKQLHPTVSKDHQRLVAELAAEWVKPTPGPEPVIFEEPDRAGTVNHVYVVWSDWADIDRAERSEIIMEAAQQRFRSGEVLSITIAMGLTPHEARQMGLDLNAA